MARKRNKPASVYRRWHRMVALAGALFIVLLVITGSLVNHSGLLGLGGQRVEQAWLLTWYGLEPPETLQSVALEDHVLTFAGNRLYLDGSVVTSTHGEPIGAVGIEGLWIAATHSNLLLLTREGELVEQLDLAQVTGAEIGAIGIDADDRVLLASGSSCWRADPDLLNWRLLSAKPAGAQWSVLATTPAAIGQQVIRAHQGGGLSLERLLLDLHSGRFFGDIGVIIYDLLALILLTLAISGLVLWQRSRGNGRKSRW